MSKVRILSDGTADSTAVMVDGEPLINVLSVSWSLDANKNNGLANATLVLGGVDVELDGDLE